METFFSSALVVLIGRREGGLADQAYGEPRGEASETSRKTPQVAIIRGVTARFALGKLPNLLSSSRLVLAAGFVLSPGPDARVGIIGVAAVTDFLDGWVARRVHATSRWGALLDPFADRVFVLTAVATFLLSGMLTEREYFVLILRDLATAIGFLIARAIPRLSAVQFKARHLGKLVTVLQLLALTTVIVAPEAVPFVLAAVALVSLVSIADYAWALWSARAA